MPELPEVETTRIRLEPLVIGKRFENVVIRAAKLRLAVPGELTEILPGQTVLRMGRRGKYLLFHCDRGCLVIHLGMTGFLNIVSNATLPGRHDHFDALLDSGSVLRFHDPRKFGVILWTEADPLAHPLLAEIGPEPLTDGFSGCYLFETGRSRKVAVKQFIMNAQVVAGVGNIYANEALFRAGLRPDRAAGSLSVTECERLAAAVKEVLSRSIEAGSTYRVAEDTVVYHPLDLNVYGRSGDRCAVCGGRLDATRQGNRSTVFCPACQK